MALVCLLGAAGAAEARSLVLDLQNNKKVYYILGGETRPVMRFVDGKVTVNADDYTVSDIKSFYISDTDDTNGIERVMTKNGVKYRANTLVLNASDGRTVMVYNAAGAPVKADVRRSGALVTVDLNPLAGGTYVVNVDGNSFKVIKR